jgi:hypothetical protein
MSLFADLNIVKNSVVPVATCTKGLISLSSPPALAKSNLRLDEWEILKPKLQDLRLDGLILLFAVQFEIL